MRTPSTARLICSTISKTADLSRFHHSPVRGAFLLPGIEVSTHVRPTRLAPIGGAIAFPRRVVPPRSDRATVRLKTASLGHFGAWIIRG